ncbi:MAG: ATP-grasp domain-containing protein [Candidatus Taylorbacteria bacterium]|nr:ATP-grasp domain-containing protein [Candidatus Taylorbacteria bacterium]
MARMKETIIYVTRDIERALGMTPNENYQIVSNRTDYGETVREQYPNFITLIESNSDDSAGTGDLMRNTKTQEIFSKVSQATGVKPYILVFKNTARIEPIAREHGWILINPPAQTSEKIENKISQILWLSELEKYLPAHRIEFMKNIRWDGKPFIIQWAHGHTGGGTTLIRSDEELSALKTKFPERRSRTSTYIDGSSFTVNVVVTPEKILMSSISYQITGQIPFTDSPFATIGNDWGLAAKILSAEDKKWIADLTNEIGSRMQKEYWRGLFGIDILKDASTGKMYLIEINARQPASTTFESRLQEAKRAEGAQGLTTFEAHIAALLGQPVTKNLIEISDGAQIIQRITKNTKTVADDVIGTLELDGLSVIPYENTAEGSDLIRIQSKKGIMSAHKEFNDVGNQILLNLKTNI